MEFSRRTVPEPVRKILPESSIDNDLPRNLVDAAGHRAVISNVGRSGLRCVYEVPYGNVLIWNLRVWERESLDNRLSVVGC